MPPNWHSYLSHDKMFFGISEIVFIPNGNTFNSYIRKTIIIQHDLTIICNILGKNINVDNFVNSFNNLESQVQIEIIINEIASIKVCRGLDLFYSQK